MEDFKALQRFDEGLAMSRDSMKMLVEMKSIHPLAEKTLKDLSKFFETKKRKEKMQGRKAIAKKVTYGMVFIGAVCLTGYLF